LMEKADVARRQPHPRAEFRLSSTSRPKVEIVLLQELRTNELASAAKIVEAGRIFKRAPQPPNAGGRNACDSRMNAVRIEVKPPGHQHVGRSRQQMINLRNKCCGHKFICV